LPLDECLYALQPTMPHLARSPLHRCLQRHDITRLPEVEGDKPAKKTFKAHPLCYFHVDIAEVQAAEGKRYLFVGIDRTSKFAYVKRHHKAGKLAAAAALRQPDRSRALQAPHRADGQLHPVYQSRTACLW
jgi:hypothetical protein